MSNVKGFKSFGARFILERGRKQKTCKNALGGIGAMIGALSKVLMVSVQDLY